jgi:hypothetical protein
VGAIGFSQAADPTSGFRLNVPHYDFNWKIDPKADVKTLFEKPAQKPAIKASK